MKLKGVPSGPTIKYVEFTGLGCYISPVLSSVPGLNAPYFFPTRSHLLPRQHAREHDVALSMKPRQLLDRKASGGG
jgi:hypothetical protein